MKFSPTSNLKVVTALKLLSRKELKKFREFTEAKYFSGKRNYCKLLESLSKMHLRGFYGMSNTDILTELSEKVGISIRTLQSRLSELYSIFEKFIVNEYLQNNYLAQSEILLSFLHGRNGFILIEYITNRIRRSEKSLRIDLASIKNLIHIRTIEALTAFENGKYKEFKEMMDLVTAYRTAEYLSSVMFQTLDQIQQTFFGTSKLVSVAEEALSNTDIEKSMQLLKRADAMMYKYTQVYYYLFKSFLDISDHSNFQKARKHHSEISGRLTRRENQELYFAFITHCINMTTLDHNEYYKILFEIIDEKLKQGYDDELKKYNYPVNNFRDYVIIGLKLKETLWVKKFIQKYSHLIPEKFRDDETRIANCRVAQAEGRFADALNLINEVKRKNYLHYLDSKNLKLRSCFELGMVQDAFEEVENLRLYFKNHAEIPQNIKRRIEMLIKDFKLLLKITDGTLSPSELRFRLRKRKPSSITPWIREKFDSALSGKAKLTGT